MCFKFEEMFKVIESVFKKCIIKCCNKGLDEEKMLFWLISNDCEVGERKVPSRACIISSWEWDGGGVECSPQRGTKEKN